MNYLTGQTYIRAPRKTRGKYMTEKRREIRRRYQQVAIGSFLIGFIFTIVFLGGKVRAEMSTAIIHSEGVKTQSGVGQVVAVELPTKLTLRIEIRNYICKKFGKDCERALKIVECESSYNVNAFNVNKNGSHDIGLWQGNSVHKTVSKACLFDARCSTDWAYQLYLKQGFTPWVCNSKI